MRMESHWLFAGEKTFGVICQRERVFPKSLTPARRAGETLSRAPPSRPAWRSHAIHWLAFSRRMTFAPLTPKGRRMPRLHGRPQTKNAALGLRFFIWSTGWREQRHRSQARRQLVLPALSSSTMPISVRRLRAASAAAQFLSARAWLRWAISCSISATSSSASPPSRRRPGLVAVCRARRRVRAGGHPGQRRQRCLRPSGG